MATLLRGHCKACGYESPYISVDPVYGLFIDGPSSCKPLFAHEDDSQIELIIDALDDFACERHKLTYQTATFQGRYVCILEWFCESCGHICRSRELAAAPAVFAFPMLGFSLGIGIVAGMLWSNFIVGVVSGILSLIVGIAVSDLAVGAYVQRKYPERAKEIQRARVCPKCHSRRAVTSGTVTCPECHQETMEIRKSIFT